ncbi:hypothetical protein KQ302_12510 [Synechococcus sp. CS-602]|uniref:hypothetical protein n=1 Tax=Synechococcaceae TaxID=1890426 RepID=UPI0008FF40AA|nr:MULTISPECIES: hypothetical protein [Synechococcaceae]MCT4363923.1 hypothetical protein [Candidatus Regnicoccus frigidus MAG-AL1]APD48453.1 hypothetical protein BM449_09675 [Synechococcus sp. SynAce01]MCT0201361.1 hypothetical protein [Synechococcus sp. CS-603]MCT0205911.1 hypothetical protein [Synechococcus sp. CS-602]MCT0246017.1 hypothetical protein [Synechococcus sp. CS-601]
MSWRFLSQRSLAMVGLGAMALALGGCWSAPEKETKRIEELEQRLQQVEQRLASPARSNPADPAGKPPAGVVKSLTFRMGSADDRLRIYWADGTSSDLPCTMEQGTWACG